MKKNRLPFICLLGILVILSAVGVWKTVYLNADIDESYALTMACRIAQGDKPFVSMWEPHQLSALLYAPVVWIFQSINGGFDGALIFMRWVGVAIQLAVSIGVYRTFQDEMPKPLALLLAGCYLSFTPKHIQSPEFTSLTYWFLMLLILGLMTYTKRGKKRYLVAAGICMSGLVLCYPAMLLVFAVLVIRFLWQKKWKEGLWFVVTCLALGLICLLYLLLGGGTEVIKNIPNVLSDASHSQSLAAVWREHIRVIWDMLKVTLPVILLLQVGRPVWDKKLRYGKVVMAAVLCVQTVWSVWQFHTINRVNFLLFYPILFQFFTIGFYAYGWYPHGERKKQMYRIGFWINVTALLAILASSNLDANYSVAFLMPSALLGIMMIWDVFFSGSIPRTEEKEVAGKEEKERTNVPVGGKVTQGICILAILVLSLQLFAARILLVRYTSTQRYNVFAGYYETYQGSLGGVHLSALDYQQYEAKIAALRQYVSPQDVFLYVGCDMFLYSSLDGAKIGTGNTISTPAFSNQLIRYYETYPDRIPTVMFVDREYAADFTVVLTQEPFRSFMQQYFDLEHPLPGGPVDVYIR